MFLASDVRNFIKKLFEVESIQYITIHLTSFWISRTERKCDDGKRV
jgi:hypothetical protein